jgi:hypothetical protein
MFLSGCKESYGCQVTFGASSCTPSGSGLGGGGNGGGGGGGGGGTAPTALAFNIVQTGTVNGIAYSRTGPSLANITSFVAPTVPSTDPSSELVIAQKQYLYGIFPATQLLYGWTIAATGTLTAMNGSPFNVAALSGMVTDNTGVNFSAVAVNPAGTFLFIADAVGEQILSFQIGAGGALTAGPITSTVGGVLQPWNLATDGHGQYLYTTGGPEGSGGQVAAYSINQSTGGLTLVGAPFAFNIWELKGDPTGQFMIGISGNSLGITGVADNHIHVFTITPSGPTAGALTEVPNSPFTTLFSPANIAVQPNTSNGSFVYSFSVNATDSAYNFIEGYALNTTTGALTAITPGSPFGAVTPSPWGQFDQSGDNLFVYSNVGGIAPELGVITVAAGTGALTESVATLPLTTGGYFAVTDPQ